MSTATISCSTPDAVIRYEIGGVDPTESSPLYSTPVEFSGEIRAKAWKEGMEASDIAVAVEEDVLTRIEIPYVYNSASQKFPFDKSENFTKEQMLGMRNGFSVVIEYTTSMNYSGEGHTLINSTKHEVKFKSLEVDFQTDVINVDGEESSNYLLTAVFPTHQLDFAIQGNIQGDNYTGGSWGSDGQVPFHVSISIPDKTPSATSATDLDLHCYVEY